MYSKDALNSLLQEEMKYYYQAAEIISANPQIKNPNLIYPGEAVKLP